MSNVYITINDIYGITVYQNGEVIYRNKNINSVLQLAHDALTAALIMQRKE